MNLLVDPTFLYITLILPLAVSMALRIDFLFIWAQFSANALFEVFAENLPDREYFALAVILNAVLAMIGYKTSRAYTLLYVVSAVYTYARMQEYVEFSGGYFAIISAIILCATVTTRYKKYKV